MSAANRQHLVTTRRELDELKERCSAKIAEDPKALGELSALGKSMKDVPDVVLAQFTLRTASIILDTLLELTADDESGSNVRDETDKAETEKGKESASAVSGSPQSQAGSQEVPPGVAAAIPLGGGEQTLPNRNARRRAARKGTPLAKNK